MKQKINKIKPYARITVIYLLIILFGKVLFMGLFGLMEYTIYSLITDELVAMYIYSYLAILLYKLYNIIFTIELFRCYIYGDKNYFKWIKNINLMMILTISAVLLGEVIHISYEMNKQNYESQTIFLVASFLIAFLILFFIPYVIFIVLTYPKITIKDFCTKFSYFIKNFLGKYIMITFKISILSISVSMVAIIINSMLNIPIIRPMITVFEPVNVVMTVASIYLYPWISFMYIDFLNAVIHTKK